MDFLVVKQLTRKRNVVGLKMQGLYVLFADVMVQIVCNNLLHEILFVRKTRRKSRPKLQRKLENLEVTVKVIS